MCATLCKKKKKKNISEKSHIFRAKSEWVQLGLLRFCMKGGRKDSHRLFGMRSGKDELLAKEELFIVKEQGRAEAGGMTAMMLLPSPDRQ